MAGVPDKILTWQMVQPTSRDRETKEVTPGRIEKTEIPVPELKKGEVLVEVAGCGVCHTDLGYFYDGVPTVNKPPLTLGHEISGTVVHCLGSTVSVVSSGVIETMGRSSGSTTSVVVVLSGSVVVVSSGSSA